MSAQSQVVHAADPVCSGDNWDRGTDTDPNGPSGPFPLAGQQVYIQDPNNYCINLPNPNDPYLIETYYSKGIYPTFVQAEGYVQSFCVGFLAPGALPMPPGAVTGAHVRTNQSLNGKTYHQITGSLDCAVLKMTCTGDNGGQYDSVPYRYCGKEPYSGVDETLNPGFADYVEIGGDSTFCMRTCVKGQVQGDPCNAKDDTKGCGVLTGGTDDTSPGFTLNGVPVDVTTTALVKSTGTTSKPSALRTVVANVVLAPSQVAAASTRADPVTTLSIAFTSGAVGIAGLNQYLLAAAATVVSLLLL
ncbi:hypothetical protein HDU81_010603 [Chytriomyces hyalinus]|nr:hypothetical protein HDU81_010603 [Chytriomyces hyalinus]